MSHSLLKVYVHLVWTTKNRSRMLSDRARGPVDEHIKQYARDKKIHIEELSVQAEHVHVLMRLAGDQEIEEIIKLLKGESSHWINQNDLVPGKFNWQVGYAAFSVDYRGVGSAIQYIRIQDQHHVRKTYVEEMFREAGYSSTEVAEMLKIENH